MMHDDMIEQLRHEILIGFEAIERGDYHEYDETTTTNLAMEIKNRGALRFAVMRQMSIPLINKRRA